MSSYSAMTLLMLSILTPHCDWIARCEKQNDEKLEGRISTKWEQHQTQYYITNRLRRSSKQWVTALIKKLWDVAWDLWQFRNRIVHDGDQGLLKLQLQQEIQEEFQRPLADFPPNIRHHFRDGLNAVLARPLHRQSSWLVCVQSGRTRQERLQKQGKLGARSMQQVMADWMRTLPRRTHTNEHTTISAS